MTRKESERTYKKVLTQANLRWFWKKHSKNGKLTKTGAKVMAQIMASEKYNFSRQPRSIQNSIIFMMESCQEGVRILERFTEIGLEAMGVKK